jgi:hypothetical protein
MEKLDANTRQIGLLLSQDSFFRVPEYQRPFSWDEDNFTDLIDDLIQADREQEYFLGTIVLHKLPTHFDVVDGQQRLTSLLLLLACLRDVITNSDYKRDIQDKILQRKNVVDEIPQRERVEVKDRQSFNKIVIAEGGTLIDVDPSSRPEPDRRYIQAINVFRSKLNNLTQPELEKLVTFINKQCVVISLATTGFEEAFRLFTIVNDRGKQLRRIDILKAMNIDPKIVTSPTVRNKLAQDWEETEKQLGEGIFESVFYLIRLILLQDKPQKDLLSEFDKRIFGAGKLKRGEPFFELVFSYSKLYAAIFIDKDYVPETAPEHRRFRALIHIMDTEFEASEWRACIVFFAHRYGPNLLYQLCLKVEKVYLAQWVAGVRKDERFKDYQTILSSIEKSKKPQEVLSSIKFDEEAIKEAVGRPDVYNVGFGKYLLLRLELATTEHDQVREFDAKSVEHVLPQNPAEGSDWLKKHDPLALKEYVNSIGNLVLLSKSKNSSAKNLDFADKKAKYLQSRVTDYPRSVQVLAYPEWTKEVIADRTQNAQELILKAP